LRPVVDCWDAAWGLVLSFSAATLKSGYRKLLYRVKHSIVL
jgi:hypothetical protein